MADERPTSFAKTIDPDGGIVAPPLKPELSQAAQPAATRAPGPPPLPAAPGSQQVTQTQHRPASPAPNGQHRTDAARAPHKAAMQKDDQNAKAYHELAAKVRQQQQAKAAKGKGLDQEKERGDD